MEREIIGSSGTVLGKVEEDIQGLHPGSQKWDFDWILLLEKFIKDSDEIISKDTKRKTESDRHRKLKRVCFLFAWTHWGLAPNEVFLEKTNTTKQNKIRPDAYCYVPQYNTHIAFECGSVHDSQIENLLCKANYDMVIWTPYHNGDDNYHNIRYLGDSEFMSRVIAGAHPNFKAGKNPIIISCDGQGNKTLLTYKMVDSEMPDVPVECFLFMRRDIKTCYTQENEKKLQDIVAANTPNTETTRCNNCWQKQEQKCEGHAGFCRGYRR